MSATSIRDGENSLPIGTRLSDFEITGILGEGGFGIVYLAFDHALQRTVAIKEYMPGALAGRAPDYSVTMRAERNRPTFNIGLKSFINEARFLAQFDHPALVKVYRFWEQNQTAYTAMQYYDGRTVKDIVARDPQLVTQAWCTKLAGQVLDALGMLGTMQLVHRDVSPDNIIVQPNGDAVLLDFGSARQILGDMTHGLTVILKPGYAPVEQYAGDATLAQGPYTDIYALSSVLYFAITGAPPPTSIARMIKDPVVPLATRDLPGYTTAFLAAIDSGMAVLADQRPQTTDAMRALLGIEQSSMALARPAGSTDRFATVAHAETPAPAMPDPDDADADMTVIASPAQTAATRAAAAALLAAQAEADDADRTMMAPRPVDDADMTMMAPSPFATQSPVAAPTTTMPPAAPSPAAPIPPPAAKPSAGKGARAAAIGAGVLVIVAIVMYALFGQPADTVMVAPSQVPPAAQADAGGAQVAGVPAAVPGAVPVSGAPSATVPALVMITDDLPGTTHAAPAPATTPTPATTDATAAAAAKPAEPVPETASYKLAIKPWGTIFVDGKERGVSPPLKRLVLPAGRHKIRVVNPGFPDYQTDVTLGASKSGAIEHDFTTAHD
jgi:hypothetical protein